MLRSAGTQHNISHKRHTSGRCLSLRVKLCYYIRKLIQKVEAGLGKSEGQECVVSNKGNPEGVRVRGWGGHTDLQVKVKLTYSSLHKGTPRRSNLKDNVTRTRLIKILYKPWVQKITVYKKQKPRVVTICAWGDV